MDPLLTTLGVELAAGTAIDAGKAVLAALRRWASSDDVEALFRELDERLGSVPGLTTVGLAPLREDADFLRLLAVFWSTAQFPRDEMIAVIERHVGATADQTPHELAVRIAEAIDLYSARAREQKGELFAIEVLRQSLRLQLDALRAEVRAAAPIRHVSVEWAPPLARSRLQRLVTDNPADLAPLDDALRDLDDPRQVIRGLVVDPPPWLANATHTTWDALGEIAGGYGLWETASSAFEAASDRPGPNRAALLGRAAANALLAGDEERYATLLSRAQALDPGHAQVVLAQLRPGLAPQIRLEILGSAPAQTDDRAEAALNVARAVAHMDLQQWDEAERLLDEVGSAVADHIALRELRPALVLGRNRVRAAEGRPVDTSALRAVAAETLDLRGELLSSYRFGEAGRLLARTATALALAGEEKEAVALLDLAMDDERADEDARRELLEAALNMGDADAIAALSFTDPADEHDQLLLAQAAIHGGNASERDRAVEALDRLITSGRNEIQAEAAFARQLASLAPGVPPSADAQTILEEHEPPLAAILAATALRRDGEHDEAEALLLRHQDDVRVLRELVRMAGQDAQWDRVVELSRTIAEGEPLPLDRLIFADALYRTGERDEALSELVALRRDDAVPTDVRRDAYAQSVRIAQDAADYAHLRRVSTEWLTFSPSDEAAAWTHLHALLRLGRSTEAITFADEQQLEPATLEQAELLAAVIDDHPDAEVVVRRVRELSDRFDRPERLEAHFLLACFRIQDDRIEDLREEVQARLASFTDRFPDSQIIKSVPIDTSPEGIDAFFREHIEPGSSHVQETAEQIRVGRAPIATFAEVVGRPVLVAAVQLERLMPLAFGDPVLWELERESADAAIGRSVVWDPTTLAVVASLPRDTSEAIRRGFAGAVVAQATIDDTRRAGDSVSMDRDEYLVMGYDAANDRRFIRERMPDEVRAERDAITRAVEIGQSLQVEPNIDPRRPTEIDALLQHESDEQQRLSFNTWPATLAVAERTRRPIFSDDRFVRIHARRAGVASFGTLALLDALEARGLVSTDERTRARAILRSSGATGVAATTEELLNDARATDWALSRELAFALLDPTAWTAPLAIGTFRTWGALLRTAFAEAPDQFELWVLRFLDAAKQHMPGASYGFIAEAILMIAWEPFTPESGAFVRAMLDVLRDSRMTFGWFRDPLPGVVRRLAAIEGSTEERQVRGLLRRALLRDLAFADQLAMLGIKLHS